MKKLNTEIINNFSPNFDAKRNMAIRFLNIQKKKLFTGLKHSCANFIKKDSIIEYMVD